MHSFICSHYNLIVVLAPLDDDENNFKVRLNPYIIPHILSKCLFIIIIKTSLYMLNLCYIHTHFQVDWCLCASPIHYNVNIFTAHQISIQHVVVLFGLDTKQQRHKLLNLYKLVYHDYRAVVERRGDIIWFGAT